MVVPKIHHTERVCTQCHELQPISRFGLTKRGYYETWCRPCKAAWARNYRRTRGSDKRDRDWHLRQRYGITEADVNAMLEAQGGGCAICGASEPINGNRYGRLHVDHCHDSGVVRGLLCGRCNRGIGMFDHDPAKLQVAMAYLAAPKDRAGSEDSDPGPRPFVRETLPPVITPSESERVRLVQEQARPFGGIGVGASS